MNTLKNTINLTGFNNSDELFPRKIDLESKGFKLNWTHKKEGVIQENKGVTFLPYFYKLNKFKGGL